MFTSEILNTHLAWFISLKFTVKLPLNIDIYIYNWYLNYEHYR